MLFKLFIFFFISFNLHANIELEGVYYVESREVNSSVVTQDEKGSFHILSIAESDYLAKIKSKDLVELLHKNGYKNYEHKSSYVNFVLKSPIDTSLIKKRVREYYEKKYDAIEIEDVVVEPRAYMQTLPDEYVVEIRERDYLFKNGTISIKTPQNMKYFFNYYIKAYVSVYESREIIKKDTKITPLHYMQKKVLLERFRAKPLQNIDNTQLQAKRHIPKGRVITHSDVELFDVVRRDAMINVTMFKEGMVITFSAKALQDAKVNDIIKVQNSNGKILKVRVTGNNRAELE
ncbi:MAG: flagellar basal body P-ring formation chaperone FlgA [Sulfurimonas sp.]|uniref:flagellar basal body P-ring formation chaperone FlgA n=1 Tax=Sulfurimonas sp. TaxID=2022749 RepID=UPI0028CD9827|nr:flagellar basal body P-ring formation chaperone FlgA [Sulfurimonas sp.]MDT8339501.1 flagellar basal body P-ring formation chaperone FlgA [Sulfurimonas sp.]